MKKINVKIIEHGERNLLFVFDNHIKNKEIEKQIASMLNYIDIDTEKKYEVTVEEYNEEEQEFYNG